MGGSSSKTVSDPANIGTRVSEETGNGNTASWKKFDYVVVGGGTAGCVVASRLSEDPNVTVLLIEAGKSEGGLFTRMPLAFTKSYGTDVDWAYNSIPQKHMGGKIIGWPRGKVLGGTSLLNASIYTRGTPEDYDQWVKAGATGWSYSELEKYFRKAENFQNSRKRNSNEQSKDRHGPVEVTRPENVAPIVGKIHEACKAVGLPHLDDPNGKGGLFGLTNLTGTVDRKGERVSSAKAYLTPEVLSRANLTVATNIVVEKILFSQSSPLHATGVQVTASKSASSYVIAATKEVILSAGTFASPQLLLLSGVGPQEDLAALNIKCLIDSPHVGRHLLDHFSSGPMIFRVKAGYTIDYLNSPLSALSALIRWLVSGGGPMGKMGVNSVAFLRSDDPKYVDTTIGPAKDLSSGSHSPDLEIMWAPAIVPSFATTGGPGEHGITIASIATKPDSEGTVTLKTNSAWDHPNIDGNFLSSESDINVIVRGMRFIMRLVRTEPLKSVVNFQPDNTDQDNYFWPGDIDPDKISDDELRKCVVRRGYPACHPVGTCRIGISADNSVVDPELKVHGINGLRIVDASIFPAQVSAHPVASIYAAAEKLADMIKASQ